jgi:tetratricopeptide (TPR) repeat protein
MPREIIERSKQAVTHHIEGRISEAETAYRAVLTEQPDYPAVLHNLGVLLASSDRLHEAINEFQKASFLDPNYEPALWSGAKALQQAERYEEAAEAYARVINTNPEHYGAHLALGKLWLWLGRRDRAMDFFARTMDLRRGENRAGEASKSLTSITRIKLLHDIEQFSYLATKQRDTSRIDSLKRAYEYAMKRIDWPDDDNTAVDMSVEQLAMFGDSYNYPNFIADAAELAGGTINSQLAVAEILESFRSKTPGLAWFDDFLEEKALARLRRYLLCSSIWFDFSHIGGFLAAYLEDGLACPLVLQIAEETREKFPEILKDHPLVQAWAFKGMVSDKPIDVHADDATISLNFWVTPDIANLSPERGGLEIYTTLPPADWALMDYNQDKILIQKFLEGQADQKQTIPYGANRAVLFDSKLFHGSDRPNFVTDYESHRINITMLFGRR